MTTTITINSLSRFNEEKQRTDFPNPFDFELTQSQTSDWSLKRRPYSRTGLQKVTDAFDVTVCRVFIPKAIVPVQPSQLFLQIIFGRIPIIDKEIGPHIKSANVFGGYSGPVCLPYPDELPNYNNTWALYPSSPSETPSHWIYESCTRVSLNSDFKGQAITVRIRDSQGYILTPPIPPANGITGITGPLCSTFVVQGGCMGYTGIIGYTGMSGISGPYTQVPLFGLGCVPCPPVCCPCDPNWAIKYLTTAKGIPIPTSISPVFYPLFQPDNQMIAILNFTYIEFDGASLSECFYPK